MVSNTEKEFFSTYKIKLSDALAYMGWEKYPETEEEFRQASEEAFKVWGDFSNHCKDDHGRITCSETDRRKLHHLGKLRTQLHEDAKKLFNLNI